MSRTASAPASIGAEDLVVVLNTLSQVPITLTTLLYGKKLRPLLADLTGLSQSHLRRGKDAELRNSTQQRAVGSVKRKVLESAAKHGWSEAEVLEHMQTTPSEVAGEQRPYADFFHALQTPGGNKLPRTVSFAEEVDKLVINLLAAHRNGEMDAFKTLILECNWADEVFGSLSDPQEAERYLIAFRAASNWGEVLNAVQIVFLNIVLCLFAALDAELGLTYFKDFQSRPLFLLVMPKKNPKLDFNALGKTSSRNLIYQPVRRLLELSHALMVWRRDQLWPKKPVGRKELGETLGLSDQYIGNFFDGTRKINAKLFDDYWGMMCEKVAKCEPFSSPLPLFLAAIFWQNSITRYPSQKIKSFILPDEIGYEKYWEWHHKRWASQLNTEAVDWPAWLVS